MVIMAQKSIVVHDKVPNNQYNQRHTIKLRDNYTICEDEDQTTI